MSHVVDFRAWFASELEAREAMDSGPVAGLAAEARA